MIRIFWIFFICSSKPASHCSRKGKTGKPPAKTKTRLLLTDAGASYTCNDNIRPISFMVFRHSSASFRSGFYADVTIALLLAISHASAFITGGVVAAISSAFCQNKETTGSSFPSTFCIVGTSSQLLDCCYNDGRRVMNSAGWDSRLLLASTYNNDGNEGSDISSNDSGNDISSISNEPDTSTWANAELPLSNDQQVTQATGAVWKV